MSSGPGVPSGAEGRLGAWIATQLPDADEVTVVPTLVRYGDTPGATAYFEAALAALREVSMKQSDRIAAAAILLVDAIVNDRSLAPGARHAG